MEGPLAVESESVQPLALFPTFVWQTRLTPETTRTINTRLLGRLDALRANLPPLRPTQMYQSNQDLHEDEAFAGFVNLVRGALLGVLDYLKVKRQDLVITGCWANAAAPGAVHPPHTHPNNFLSGVYYLRAPERGNRISFHDPRPQTYVLSPMVSRISMENGSFINVTIAEGCLLIFPAWLQHQVPPNDSAVERVSVSFNAMFPDYAETLAGRRDAAVTGG